MEVGDGGCQHDLVGLEPGAADLDDDVAQRLALPKVVGDREGHVGKVVLKLVRKKFIFSY